MGNMKFAGFVWKSGNISSTYEKANDEANRLDRSAPTATNHPFIIEKKTYVVLSPSLQKTKQFYEIGIGSLVG